MVYTYLIGSAIFFAVWLILFLTRKDLRGEMLWASLIPLPAAFLEVVFIPEYWNPVTILESIKPFTLESFFFIFSVGGIASVIYEIIFKKKHKKSIKYQIDTKKSYILSIMVLSLIILMHTLNLNIIYDTLIAMFIGAIYIFIIRKDLRKEIIAGALIFTILYFLIFIILLIFVNPLFVVNEYNLLNLSGVFILGIPIEEILFALALGAVWSPMYDAIKGYKIK